MAFKMKRHTFSGINQKSEGNTDLTNGRSGSAAFQMKGFPFQGSSPMKQKVDEKGESIFNKPEAGIPEPSQAELDAGYAREDEYSGKPLAGGPVTQPTPENYPGPTNISVIKKDKDGLYFLTDDARYNLPDGFADYTGVLKPGDDIDETALEEMFGMDQGVEDRPDPEWENADEVD